MYNFILQILLMASLAVMIYLAARGVSRISDTAEESVSVHYKSRFDRLVAFLPTEKIDLLINEYFEKILRKIKLWLMKLDNTVTGRLDKIKEANDKFRNNNSQKPNLFSEDTTSEGENARGEKKD